MVVEKILTKELFINCSKYTLDKYWQQIFENCSQGRYPKGCRYDAEAQCIIFNKGLRYDLKNKETDDFVALKRLFQEQLYLKSEKDNSQSEKNINVLCQNLKDIYKKDWKVIKGKKFKEPFVREYIYTLACKYNLSNNEIINVYKLIKLSFLFKWIQNEDVEYKNGEILDIKSLHFDQKNRDFTIDKNVNEKIARKFKKTKIKLSSLWLKYINQKI